MAQIHSFYITNAQSELNFSSNNLSENELEIALQDITSAMIDNNDLFDEEEEDNDYSDNDSINLEEENTDDLIMAEIMDLDIPEFGEIGDFEDSRDSEENREEVSIVSDSINSQSEVSNINFEAILAEEFD